MKKTETIRELEKTAVEKQGKKSKLWNINFLLLWQGQFVSAVGDVAYEIALGFWILAVTGSTGLMGTLLAASTIPRVLLAPFAGVLVDRTDRKWLLVLMDAIRGAVVVLIGIIALTGHAAVWMVFASMFSIVTSRMTPYVPIHGDVIPLVLSIRT